MEKLSQRNLVQKRREKGGAEFLDLGLARNKKCCGLSIGSSGNQVLVPVKRASPSLQPDRKLFLKAGEVLGGGSGLCCKWRLG